MKTAKKRFALFLVLALTLAMGIAVLADGEETTTAYSIIVNDAVAGQTYTAYKVFDLTYAENNYSYTISKDSPFFATVNAKDEETEDNKYGLTLTQIGDTDIYLVEMGEDFESHVAALASDLITVVTDTTQIAGYTIASIPDGGETASANIDVTGSGAGYYLVDSSLGALCALDSTTPSVTVNEKNSLPSLDKKVSDSEDGTYDKSTTASIGDTVYFTLTANTGSNTNGSGTGVDGDYVITDTLPQGMTFQEIVSVSVGDADWTENDYSYDNDNRDVLTITLKKESVAKLAQNSNIVIKYTATLDEDCFVDSTGAEATLNGNTNTATLSYNGYTTVETEATVYTFKLPVFKYTNANEEKTPLAGATFTLTKEDSNEIALVDITDDREEAIPTYRVATDEDEETVTEITTTETGEFFIEGLKAGTYSLTETKAPAGYNQLTAPVTVTIGEKGTLAVGDVTANRIEIENKTGSTLPGTGGIGTTIFYIVGAVLIVGAGVLLVVRRRISAEKKAN